ncbi:MAG: glucokinase [Pelagimonas sp.]|jgi:glucokinase|nr:glucokinase [Pelagimonas sp.]
MTHPVNLVADFGGTNGRVALCENGQVRADTIQRYRNADHPSIEAVLSAFLSHHDVRPRAVCIDIAGPVENGQGRVTNRDWLVTLDSLRAATGAQTVDILNDMQAQGHAMPTMPASSLDTLHPGTKEICTPQATRLVVNIGTGLNAAIIVNAGGVTCVPAGEFGHMALLARDPEELALRDWIAARHPEPSLEDILSGRGFERLHAWVCHDEGRGTPLDAAAIHAAYQANDPQAVRAMQLFARFAGRYCSDLAMCTLPHGGIFLVGGVMNHLGRHLIEAGFMQAYANKGRFTDFVQRFPLHLVTDDYAALRGCAAHLQEMIAPPA